MWWLYSGLKSWTATGPHEHWEGITIKEVSPKCTLFYMQGILMTSSQWMFHVTVRTYISSSPVTPFPGHTFWCPWWLTSFFFIILGQIFTYCSLSDLVALLFTSLFNIFCTVACWMCVEALWRAWNFFLSMTRRWWCRLFFSWMVIKWCR